VGRRQPSELQQDQYNILLWIILIIISLNTALFPVDVVDEYHPIYWNQVVTRQDKTLKCKIQPKSDGQM
jgi:hypothetical protein